MAKKYITYGKGNVFCKDLLPDKNDLDTKISFINKVPGTLWGSPIDAKYGWEKWCKDWNFHLELLRKDNCFTWSLKPTAKVLYISSIKDLNKIPYVKQNMFLFENVFVDYSKIIQEYDAMELCMDNGHIGHMFVSEEEQCFNSWDCDSIMVFNKEMIIAC